jgi:Cu(I)/Ag(I) efflux system membrane fusion protein
MNAKKSRFLAGLRACARRMGLLLGAFVCLAAGFALRALLAPDSASRSADSAETAPRQVETEWTCSMHPQIRGERGDLCPICSMDLVPVSRAAGGAEGTRHPRELSVSEAAKALMDIETAPVERRFVAAVVRMVGKVDYDQTRLADIAARVAGRLDRLYVDYAGIPVRKGDHLVWIYSPELLAAQEELLQARQAAETLGERASDLVRESTEATYAAAREKLLLLGLSEEQLDELQRSGEPSDHLTIYSPVAGVVIDKNAKEGAYVETGTRIYTVADLSRMWVHLDAYESDLSWLRYGQKVEFEAEAYPGESFEGTISFIDPVLDADTRTARVRVNVPNEDRRLKPGMFVRARVRSLVAAGGRVMEPDLAGKWISPMHPEIVKDEPGTCDVCGMDLVRAESLGYLSADPNVAETPLVIPASAPLITGERAVVYVEVPGGNRPTYRGREIVLGPRAGQHYLVRSGLREGERVVTRGAFKIDSALQIQARPSMMSPGTGADADAFEEAAPPEADAAAVVNVRCPIMDTPIDPADVPEDLVRVWKGRRIGFCCAGCPEMWDELDEAEKQAKLAGALPDAETADDE